MTVLIQSNTFTVTQNGVTRFDLGRQYPVEIVRGTWSGSLFYQQGFVKSTAGNIRVVENNPDSFNYPMTQRYDLSRAGVEYRNTYTLATKATHYPNVNIDFAVANLVFTDNVTNRTQRGVLTGSVMPFIFYMPFGHGYVADHIRLQTLMTFYMHLEVAPATGNIVLVLGNATAAHGYYPNGNPNNFNRDAARPYYSQIPFNANINNVFESLIARVDFTINWSAGAFQK